MSSKIAKLNNIKLTVDNSSQVSTDMVVLYRIFSNFGQSFLLHKFWPNCGCFTLKEMSKITVNVTDNVQLFLNHINKLIFSFKLQDTLQNLYAPYE